jgi:tRNA(Ile)-lysidine synthase TilS/MesJ
MNENERFTRVRIRKTVIPILAEINPNIVQTLAQTAELMGLHAGETSGANEDELVLKDLRELSKGELYRWLRGWLGRKRGNLRGIQLKHIEAVEHLISSRKSGKTVEIPGGGRVVKHRGRLMFSNIKVEK